MIGRDADWLKIPDGVPAHSISDDPIALDQADEHYNDCNDQEDVNESAHRVGRDESQKPGDNQNHSERV